MNSRNRHWIRALGPLFCVLAFSLVGCGLFDDVLPTTPGDDPPGETTTTVPGTGNSVLTPYPTPTSGVVAPEVRSPAPGSEVVGLQPTLVVENSKTGDKHPLTYTFEVSHEESFKNIVASAHGIDQGGGGKTSWQVPEALETRQYYWRARAQAGFVKSPFSSVANFIVSEVPEPAPPDMFDGEAEISDPLTNGMSVGQVNGGVFTDRGWEVKRPSDYIRYQIQPRSSGFVEWETLGLRRSNPSADQFMLMGMWDPTAGDYRANPFRVHIQKLDRNHNPPAVRLRWIANGEQHDKGYDFIDWDPGEVYQWHLEWGPAGGSNEVRVYLNGQLIISSTYRRAYNPSRQWVELGIEERSESIVGTIYRNVQIGGR